MKQLVAGQGWIGAAAGIALALAAQSAQAQQTFTPPPGCQGFVTVQARGCKVSNHYICSADPAGDQWRVDFGARGPYFVSRIDAEAQWVYSLDLATGAEQHLAPGAADPASFSGLLRSGTDTYDFSQVSDDGARNRVRGFDTLTGRKVVIDGVELEETSFEFRETTAEGEFLNTARGKEYISRKWRLFFSGPSEWDGGEGFAPYDQSPVRFDFPGDKGFMSVTPEYECDDQIAGLPVHRVKGETP